jgi:hypothetical protein
VDYQINPVDLFEQLESEKSTLLSLWQEIGEFCYPNASFFTRYTPTQGQKRRRVIYDSTAEQALDIFASSLSGLIANPATKWIGFTLTDTELHKDKEVSEFLDDAQNFVLSVLSNPRNRFYDNFNTFLKTIGAFGVCPFMIEEDKDTVAKFRSETPKGLNYTEDFSGNVKDIYLERELSAAALIEKAEKDDWDIPARIREMKPHDKVKILRCIKNNPDYDSDKQAAKFGEFVSEYYDKETKTLMKRGFFNTMPIAIGRWNSLDGDKWPDSCARMALADVKTVNVADMSMLTSVEKSLKPTLFISSEAKFGKLNTSPGAVNVGRGNPNDTVREISTKGAVNEVMHYVEMKRQSIRNAFFVDVFQMNTNLNMTATEAHIRNQERLRGLGPKIAKIQSDVIAPIAQRILYIGIRQGKLTPPRALIGKDLPQVTYQSPLSQAQRLQDANNILQYLGDLSQIAQFKPDVLDRIDIDMIAKELAEIRGVPARTIVEDDDVKKVRDLRQQQMQAQQQMALLQQAGETAQSLQPQ